MQRSSLPGVWLALDDSELQRRCEQALSETLPAGGQKPSLADSSQVDVIVSDHIAFFSHAVECSEADCPGTVLIGPSGPADVELPRDFLPRELQLACRLLSQVVQLRRQSAQQAGVAFALRDEALCDPLTGCANRRAWQTELLSRRDAARRCGQSLCLALFDVDHLKQVNTAWGHLAGDHLLRAAADALRDSLRQGDFVARLGGDEFGVLLSGLKAQEAHTALERVRAGLPARLAQAGAKATSISVGYAITQGQVVSGDELFAAADQALRTAKQQSADRVVQATLPAPE